MKEGSKITIHIEGFHVPYITPPVPKLSEIAGHNLPKKQQKWIRPVFPSDEEAKLMPKSEVFEIIKTDLIRRIEGYWFMNNGTPTYITGSHYFTLTHWYMAAVNKDGYPEYRNAAKLWFYTKDIADKDENCFGLIMMCQKRFGKTEYELADIYNKATRGGIRVLKGLVIEDKDCLFGMQSLTATEAKNNLFKSRLMRSHMKIQRYLKPESNETGSKREIVGELTFKGTNIGGGKYKDALRNTIDHRPTLVSAYQGKRPRQIFIDEPGSIEEMDLENWWTTVKEQLALGTKAFGKAFLPTTLETMTPRGADAFKKIWEESDPKKRDSNGRTTSGLYRYFKAQYFGREDFIDEYGDDLIEEARQFRANQLENASPSQQQKIKRQYPETEEEAFGLIIGGVWEDDVKEALVADEALCATSVVRYVTLRMSNGAIVESFAPKTDETAVKILEEVMKNTLYSLGIDSATTDDETGDSGGSKIAAVATKGAGEGACMYSPTIAYSERALNKEACYHKIFLIARYIIDKGGILKITGEINGGGADCFRYLCNRGLKPYMTGTPKQYANSAAGDKTGQYWLYVGPDLLRFLHGLGNRFLRFCHEHGTGVKILSVVQSLIKYKGTTNEDEASAYLISLWNFRDFDKFEKKTKKPPVKMPKFNQETGMWED